MKFTFQHDPDCQNVDIIERAGSLSCIGCSQAARRREEATVNDEFPDDTIKRLEAELNALRADVAQQAADAALGRAYRLAREAWNAPRLHCAHERTLNVWEAWMIDQGAYQCVGEGPTELEALTAATAAARGKT